MGDVKFLNFGGQLPEEEEQDPREKEILQIGVDRLDNNEHFAVIFRTYGGKVIIRTLAHFIDGLADMIRDELKKFYLPLNEKVDQGEIEKSKKFLEKSAKKEVEKKNERHE